LAAAIQTIIEVGDSDAVAAPVDAAFPGASLTIATEPDARFAIEFRQPGLLRPLSGAELSDGTLRFLLWLAALLTPRPPSMMVLNEPETSLHPDLLPALSHLIIKAAETTQVWVVTHSTALIRSLSTHAGVRAIELQKELGQTQVKGQDLLDKPLWRWAE
jgi:predicted ATPase